MNFTKVSVTIYAGGVVVSALLGIPFWIGTAKSVPSVFEGYLYRLVARIVGFNKFFISDEIIGIKN